ncbi:hypothetical protein D9619_007136 [Psilocybe cf. subviscida]|uniref:C3H1-type domain-containing protein n=1 Tax=Psilocybe cf. subviscida TaxID=2480587 RepID=A0A8H5EWX7_9AGAR|nr:hypothetical protein D9619_007136 [Psilocybe cf. subviscida]
MKKSSALKKRHTKPCKFFQTNRCPHSADVCDFAHVLADPFGGMPFDTSLPICRYYYAGHCANGIMCRYRHESQLAVSPTDAYPVRVASNSVADWAAVTSAEATYPDSPSSLYPSPPAYVQAWAPTAYATHTHAHPRSPDSVSAAACGAPPTSARSRDSMPSLDTTSTTTATSSAESDDVVFATTSDPKYAEHTHSHQSQVYIADDVPVVHVPPFRGAPLIPYPLNTHVAHHHQVSVRTPTSVYQQHDPYAVYSTGPGSMGGKTPPSSGSRRSPSLKSLKQKAIKYKTKPCKFFPTEKGCPNGNACNFIHDEQPHIAPSIARKAPSSPKSPSSPLKEKEGTTRKDFVPIPWRVIGGGVRLSANTSKVDDSAEQVSYKFDAAHAKDCMLPSRPPQLNLLPIKVVSRQRSNSIPSTPSIAQIKVEHLFSAESPGVL